MTKATKAAAAVAVASLSLAGLGLALGSPAAATTGGHTIPDLCTGTSAPSTAPSTKTFPLDCSDSEVPAETCPTDGNGPSISTTSRTFPNLREEDCEPTAEPAPPTDQPTTPDAGQETPDSTPTTGPVDGETPLPPVESTPDVEEPVTEPGDDPTTPPYDQPTTPPVEEPVTEPGDDPTTPPYDQPTTPPTPEPTTPPLEEPTTPPTDEPTTPPSDEPTTPPSEEPTTPPTEPTTPPSDEPSTPPSDTPTTPPTDVTTTTPVNPTFQVPGPSPEFIFHIDLGDPVNPELPVAAPPAGNATWSASNDAGWLAATGADTPLLIAGTGGLLLAAGLGAVGVSRRREAAAQD